MLEERIMEFSGTLLLVSHDRSFLENTVTNLITVNASGQVEEHNGGYEDWITKKQELPLPVQTQKKTSRKEWKARPRRFSKKDQEELDSIPGTIEAIDQKRSQIAQKLADPQTYKLEPTYAESSKSELAALEAESDRVFERWEELESLKESIEKDGG